MDIGLGKELFLRLVLNESIISVDNEVEEIFKSISDYFEVNDLKQLYSLFEEEQTIYKNLSLIGK